MVDNKKGSVDSAGKNLKELRNELWIVVPFFLISLGFFLGSFRLSWAAGGVPMLVGLATSIMMGLRLFHIIFPQSKIGEFSEGGLAGEFDRIQEEIEEETLKGRHEEPEEKEVTAADERKAFLGAIISFVIFLLLGYIVGSIVLIVALGYYYGYKEKLPIAIVMTSFFLIVYVVLYKLMEGPDGFGLLLKPILKSFDLL
jgi:hypothetical protein